MAEHDTILVVLTLFGSWILVFASFRDMVPESSMVLFLIADSIGWAILGGAYFYWKHRQKQQIAIIPAIPSPDTKAQQKDSDTIILKKSSIIYGVLLLVMLFEGVVSVLLGVFTWQVAIINGVILFTFSDFVSTLLMVIGIILLVGFIRIYRLRHRK